MTKKDGKHENTINRGGKPRGETTAARAIRTENVNRLIEERLPGNIVRLLRQLGAMADERHVPMFLVGGFVRDVLLRCSNWDLDVTVEGDGVEFARAVADRYGAGLVLFERFATARLVLPSGLKLDIASTRRESYVQPAALPQVKPASLGDDLYRRDFTINAMAVQLNAARYGILHDPYGGRRDLASRSLRVLHERSFIDDPTRIFRAIRFSERLGFRLEVGTKRLLKAAATTNLIAQLSGPRLRNEIFLLANEPNPNSAFSALARLRLFRFLHPKLRYGSREKRLVRALPRVFEWWTKRCKSSPIDRSLTVLMALLVGASPEVSESVIARLALSNEQARRVRAGGAHLLSVARAMGSPQLLKPSKVYRLLQDLPEEAMVLGLAKLTERGPALERMRRRVVDYLTKFYKVKPSLRGDDLVKMGVPPGPQIGSMLAKILEARLDGLVKGNAGERVFVRAALAGSR